jgi:hypothetical protein
MDFVDRGPDRMCMYNVWHLFSPSFDVCSRGSSECQSVRNIYLTGYPAMMVSVILAGW